jgi:hypothetical protein
MQAESGVALGHEELARRAAHGVQHALIEHVPCAHLLRDHLAARELDLHVQLLDGDDTYSARNRRSAGRTFREDAVGISLTFMVNVAWALAPLG